MLDLYRVTVVTLLAIIYYGWRRRSHPLYKYPGPLLNSVSAVPGAWQFARGRQHSYLRVLHAQYGNIVRVAPNELSFTDVAAWQDIYNAKPSTMERQEIPRASVGKYTGRASIVQALFQTKDHARHRRALGYPFSMNGILEQQAIVIAHVKKFISCVNVAAAAAGSKGVDMTSWCGFLTMDVIGDLTFGKTFGCLDDGGPTEWSVAMIQVFRSGAYENAIQQVLGVGTWTSRFVKWLLAPKLTEHWRRLHFDNCMKAAKQRMSQGPGSHRDVMHFLLRDKGRGLELSEREILLNMPVMIFAGSETTAGTLSSLLFFLCTHSSAYDRLTKEIRNRFGSEDEIVFHSVQPDSLPYLDACLRETLRCVPPQTNTGLREVPRGGASICGWQIPEGCSVGVNPFAITHLEHNFARPDEFHPERWLARDDADWNGEFADDKLEASQPFMLGPQQCLGINLAWLELRITMAYITFHFDFSLVNDAETRELWTMEDDARHFKGLKTWLKPPLPIAFTRRER